MLRFEDTFCGDSTASDIICTFINNRLIGLLEDRMFLYDEKGYEAIKDDDMDFAEEIEILFPQSYPKEKMTGTFLGLYTLLKADDSFVPNLTMEYLLAQLISSQVSLMEDSFQPTTEPVPERAYVLGRLKEECEDDNELAYRLNSIEDMKEYLETAYDFDVLKSEIECETSDYYFYLDGNDAVGFVKVNWADSQTEPDYPDALEIQRIYSLKEYHGHGIGAALMEHAISVARELKRPMMWLGVEEQNKRAYRFYTKYGFKKVGTHVFMLGEDEQHDSVLVKNLED